MRYLTNNIRQSFRFLKQTSQYFKNVVLMNGFILFVVAPLLVTIIRFILQRGDIPYLSYDTIGDIFFHHPFVLLSLLIMLVLILLILYFEFTFLLLTMYFIQKRQKVSLGSLLKETMRHLRKFKVSNFFAFLFYFLLLSPIGWTQFNSELLSKVKVPIFIVDFIFENRISIIAVFIALYVALLYLGIRLIFTLPLMILNNDTFRVASRSSWEKTKKSFLAILGQLIFVAGTITLVVLLFDTGVIYVQYLVDAFYPSQALKVAILLLTILQIMWVINMVLSTIGIFFVTISFMDSRGWLPELSKEFLDKTKSKYQSTTSRVTKLLISIGLGVILLFGVLRYNTQFLQDQYLSHPIAISHRGVDNGNHVQNSLESLTLTSQEAHPDFIEMDIQETKDNQFVVMHDFNLKQLTGIKKRPKDLTLEELIKLDVHDNQQSAKIASFDDYFKQANDLNQKLLIEIKATKDDSDDMLERFVQLYGKMIHENGHEIQSLSFDVVTGLKEIDDSLVVGYIMPFSIAGPPDGEMDFYSIEYTTLTTNLVKSVHQQNKQLYVWTPNDEETMTRMMFYGVDAIITDRVKLLNSVRKKEQVTYADKLIYFLVGVG